jgi:hypothetical protein
MSIWETVAAPILKIIDKVVPDKAAAQAAKDQLTALTAQGQLQEELAELQAVTSNQTDVDKIEAASTNMFVAGARPFVMWVCGVALAVSTIVAPLFTWLSALVGHPTAFPNLDNPLLQSTLAGMLGLGHITRTVEKIQGVVGNH